MTFWMFVDKHAEGVGSLVALTLFLLPVAIATWRYRW
jgi:hypothetical protein